MASSTLASSALRSSRRTFRSLMRIPAIRAAILSAVFYALLPFLGEPLLTQLQLSTGVTIHPLILGAIYSILALVSGAGAAFLPALALFTRRGRRDFRVMIFVLVAPLVVAYLFPTQYATLLELLHGYGL